MLPRVTAVTLPARVRGSQCGARTGGGGQQAGEQGFLGCLHGKPHEQSAQGSARVTAGSSREPAQPGGRHPRTQGTVLNADGFGPTPLTVSLACLWVGCVVPWTLSHGRFCIPASPHTMLRPCNPRRAPGWFRRTAANAALTARDARWVGAQASALASAHTGKHVCLATSCSVSPRSIRLRRKSAPFIVAPRAGRFGRLGYSPCGRVETMPERGGRLLRMKAVWPTTATAAARLCWRAGGDSSASS